MTQQQQPQQPQQPEQRPSPVEERTRELEGKWRKLKDTVTGWLAKAVVSTVAVVLAFVLLWKLLLSPVGEALRDEPAAPAAKPAAAPAPDPKELERLREEEASRQ